MGAWGAGNFQDDGALDYVGSVIDGLVSRIVECFADEEMSRLDEYGEAVIVPSVEIISLLHENCKAAPPKVEVVSDWKTRYLAIFDAQIDGIEPKGDFAAERRAVIAATFERLENQAKAFWGDS